MDATPLASSGERNGNTGERAPWTRRRILVLPLVLYVAISLMLVVLTVKDPAEYWGLLLFHVGYSAFGAAGIYRSWRRIQTDTTGRKDRGCTSA